MTGVAVSSWLLAPGVAAAACSNDAVRAQQGSTALPDCRAYEQVSPVDKNGTDVQDIAKQTPDGRAISWESLGAYADAHDSNAMSFYVGRRTPAGWTTNAISPRYSRDVPPDISTLWGANEIDESLTQMSFVSWGSFDPLDQDSNGFFGATDVYRVQMGGETTWVSRPVGGGASSVIAEALLAGTSADGSSLFFQSPERLDPAIPDGNTYDHLYRWRDGEPELVGLDPNGDPLPYGSRLGTGATFATPSGNGSHLVTMPDAVATSRDGSRLVFRSGDAIGFTTPGALFLHRDGQPTVEVSLSQRAGSVGDPAPSGVMLATTLDDVRKVVFMSADQLTDDAPAGGGYYLYEVATGDLRFLQASNMPGHSYPGGLTAIDDGARYLYFVSAEVLTPEGQAGAANLYVRSPDRLRFIAEVALEDSLNAWAQNGSVVIPAYTRSDISRDGTKLVFETRRQATSEPNGGVSQVYLYDAVADDLRCLSCAPVDGSTPALGTVDALRDILNVPPPAITADGRGVYFTSASPLAAGDVNGKEDVYEYRDGALRLLSKGTAPHDTKLVGLSPDGADVYVVTRDRLVPGDTDSGLIDLYDIRVDGGFLAPDPPSGCYGAACQGGSSGGGGGGSGAVAAPAPPTAGPPAPPVPPKATLIPPAQPDATSADVEPTVEISSVPKRLASVLADEGIATVRVRVSRAGRVALVARARIDRRARRVAKGSIRARERGEVRIDLEVTRAGRRLLRDGGAPLRLTASLDRGAATADLDVGAGRRTASSTTRNGR